MPTLSGYRPCSHLIYVVYRFLLSKRNSSVMSVAKHEKNISKYTKFSFTNWISVFHRIMLVNISHVPKQNITPAIYKRHFYSINRKILNCPVWYKNIFLLNGLVVISKKFSFNRKFHQFAKIFDFLIGNWLGFHFTKNMLALKVVFYTGYKD